MPLHVARPSLGYLSWLLLPVLFGAPGCSKRGEKKDGVIVRQVLHGSDVLGDSVAETDKDSAPRAMQPGQVATTLVTDTPQAAYKQAAEATRRKLEATSARQALSQIETQIEQEQESLP